MNPAEEQQVGEQEFDFPGGDDEIVDRVQNDRTIPVGEEDSEDENDEEKEEKKEFTSSEVIELCSKLEGVCLGNENLDPRFALNLVQGMRKVRGVYNRKRFASMEQGTLDHFICRK